MSKHWRRLLVTLGLSAWLALYLSAGPAGAVGVALRLRADPERVPADGKSQAVITVEATDALGIPVADGTPVHVVTTLGKVVSPVQTIGGLAQTSLTAPRSPGLAVVSVVVGSSRASLSVEFLAQPGSVPVESQLVELSAQELSYSADKRVFIAMGQADLHCNRLRISADGVQYDMDRGVVCAQGNVTARIGERSVTADAMRYELSTMRGDLLRVGDGGERFVVEGQELAERPNGDPDFCVWEPLDTGDTRTWVKARRAIVDPGEKVILDHATFYVNDVPVMSLRRHVLDPALGSAVFGQTLSYSSASGVAVDFPWYYRASANRIGSFHLTRNRALNGYDQGLGWAVGLREEYLHGTDVSGTFMLDDFIHPRRGVHWEHGQPLGGSGRLSLDAEAFAFDDDSPRFRTGSLTYSQPAGAGALSLMLSHTGYGGSEQQQGDLTYRFPATKAGSGIRISPSLHLRHSRAENPEGEILVDTGTGEPLVMTLQGEDRRTSLGADLNFLLPALKLTSRAELSAGLTTGYYKTLSAGGQSLFDARLSLDQSFSGRAAGPKNRATLTYTFSGNPSAGQATLFSSPRQMLSLSTVLTIKGCAFRGSASQELGGSRRYGSLSLSRALPFGSDGLGQPLWSLQLSHFFTRVDTFSADHSRISLRRLVGRYHASLCYSPQGVGDFDSRPWVSGYGYGYTYSGGRHFWLELSAAAD